MKTIKVIFILVVFPFTLFSQNQEVKGTDPRTDPVWLAKHTALKEYTVLRVNVGDMQIKLLQKIEELMLHSIQLEKEYYN